MRIEAAVLETAWLRRQVGDIEDAMLSKASQLTLWDGDGSAICAVRHGRCASRLDAWKALGWVVCR